MNPRNSAIVTGRLSRKPVILGPNADGSHKALLTIAAKDNFQTKGEYASQFVPIEAYIRKDSRLLDTIQALNSGDLVSASYAVRTPKPYKDSKTNELVYPVVLQLDSLDTTLESKATREARALAAASVTSSDGDDLAE